MLFSLFSCGVSSSKKDQIMRDDTAAEIVKAVETESFADFKELLSNDVLSLDDSEDGFRYMTELLKGPVMEIVDLGGGSNEVFDSNGNGKTLLGSYELITESKEYELDFELVVENGDKREAVGLIFIKLFDIDSADQERPRRSSNTYGRLGVFNPNWNQE